MGYSQRLYVNVGVMAGKQVYEVKGHSEFRHLIIYTDSLVAPAKLVA